MVLSKFVEETSNKAMFFYSDKKRARGNDLYARGDYNGAINAYKRFVTGVLASNFLKNILHQKLST